MLVNPAISSALSITRRSPNTTNDKLSCISEADSNLWPSLLSSASPPPDILISALGTTRDQGPVAAQTIDRDLNIALAKAAKSSGTKVYVLVTVAGADSTSFFAYTKRKGEIEDAIREIKFNTTIFLRPGYIAGRPQSREWAEAVLEGVANVGKQYCKSMTDKWCQSAETIAQTAVSMSLRALAGQVTEKVVVLERGQIVEAKSS